MEGSAEDRPEKSQAVPPAYLGYREAAGFLRAHGLSISEASLRRMVSQRRIVHFKPFKKDFNGNDDELKTKISDLIQLAKQNNVKMPPRYDFYTSTLTTIHGSILQTVGHAVRPVMQHQ